MFRIENVVCRANDSYTGTHKTIDSMYRKYLKSNLISLWCNEKLTHGNRRYKIMFAMKDLINNINVSRTGSHKTFGQGLFLETTESAVSVVLRLFSNLNSLLSDIFPRALFIVNT